jgi:hypothetical protein
MRNDLLKAEDRHCEAKTLDVDSVFELIWRIHVGRTQCDRIRIGRRPLDRDFIRWKGGKAKAHETGRIVARIAGFRLVSPVIGC